MRYRGGRIAQKLKTQRERERYRARKHIGELPFGWSKSVLRFRRFSLRDLDNVNEWEDLDQARFPSCDTAVAGSRKS